MTTSGTYSFYVTRDNILRMAALNLNKLDQYEGLTPQETTDMSMWLNMLVKQWMGKTDFAPGLKVFSRRHGHLMLSSLVNSYTLNSTTVGWTNTLNQTNTSATVSSGSVVPVVSTAGMTTGDNFGVDMDAGYVYWSKIQSIGVNSITITGTIPSQASSGASIYSYTTGAQTPLDIETAFLRDATNNDTPLTIMTLEQYDALPTKASKTYLSDPTGIYYEFQNGYGTLFTDVAGCSDGSKHICLSYMEPSQDFNNPLDTPYYPQQWYLPLSLALSKLCVGMFDAAWTPVLEDNYKTALAIAQQKDPEVSVQYFQCKD